MPKSTIPYLYNDPLFLIPARSGSKGIPKKNLQKINGQTLVEISIRQALMVGKLDNIFLSSDSFEILEYAEIFRIKSILRTSKESSDESDANTVVKHFIDFYALHNFLDTTIVYLQPTSPFRVSNLISECIGLHKEHKIPVVTVRKVVDHPQKMINLIDGKIKNYLPEFKPTGNRQDLPDLFTPSGSVYVFSIQNFLENECKIPITGAIPVLVYGEDLVDIDTDLDLFLAQKIGEKYEF